MDIINLRHDVLGKTAYGKTFCVFLVFVSTCRKARLIYGGRDQGVVMGQGKNVRKI